MITGFEKIVEERIKKAQEQGAFDDLPGAGRPLDLSADTGIPEELRLAYKILKNSDCLPPEIELKKEICSTEQLLSRMPQTAERYAVLKKLNYLILKFNAARRGSALFDLPQHYAAGVVDRLSSRKQQA